MYIERASTQKRGSAFVHCGKHCCAYTMHTQYYTHIHKKKNICLLLYLCAVFFWKKKKKKKEPNTQFNERDLINGAMQIKQTRSNGNLMGGRLVVWLAGCLVSHSVFVYRFTNSLAFRMVYSTCIYALCTNYI